MKNAMQIISSLLLAAVAVGCSAAGAKSATERKSSRTAEAKLDKAKTETNEAAQAVQDYAYAQKAEFVDKMKGDLAEIQGELDRLSARVDKSRGAAKDGAKKKLAVVRGKWARAKGQLDQAENATESSWDEVKAGFKKAHGDLKESFEDSRQWLSDKIEP